ncbi:MAG: hypothetical protein AB1791_13760 [Chloroflexota bacterium]
MAFHVIETDGGRPRVFGIGRGVDLPASGTEIHAARIERAVGGTAEGDGGEL